MVEVTSIRFNDGAKGSAFTCLLSMSKLSLRFRLVFMVEYVELTTGNTVCSITRDAVFTGLLSLL